MAIPDFQSCMLPLLELCADGKEKSMKELAPDLAAKFKLSTNDLETRLRSGAPVFSNRIAWAKVYLQKAGLIEPVRRGVFQITQIGLSALAEKPDHINTKYLKKFKEDEEGKEKDIGENESDENLGGDDSTLETGKTPDELISDGYKFLRAELASQLLEEMRGCSWQFFEKLVIDLLLAMGYGDSKMSSSRAFATTRDGGVDGVINEDKLGLNVIYTQAKKWNDGTPIGSPEIQKFVGALHGKKAKKGVFITTTRFTKDAKDFVEGLEVRVILIDGERLANLMIDHNVGVSIRDTFTIKRMDSDYFIEE